MKINIDYDIFIKVDEIIPDIFITARTLNNVMAQNVIRTRILRLIDELVDNKEKWMAISSVMDQILKEQRKK